MPKSVAEMAGGSPITRPAVSPQATSIRIEIEVGVPIQRAFRVFTRAFDRIKPREHNLLEVEIEETVLEPQVGGSAYDRGVGGTLCQRGRVLSVDPPDAIVFGTSPPMAGTNGSSPGK